MLGKLRFVSPLRCLDCNKRFIGRTLIWQDLFYARCPMCLRMDLNGWTGKTYTDPPFLVAVKVALGARKWRCEYCRLNFASFRRRKEVFTFKRWAKFGPGAEAHNRNLEMASAESGASDSTEP
jgi:DNA-directed RNA polymerase subunit RPC12/RpoP